MATPCNLETACVAGACEQVIGSLESAAQLQPDNPLIYYRLGACYSGGCRLHAFVHAGMALAYLRRALELLGPGPSNMRAAVLESLGYAVTHSRDLAAWQASRDYYLQALAIYESMGTRDDRARAHFNVANCCCELSEFSEEDHWREAVVHYEESLRVRSRGSDPERCAAVLENLGTAYRRLPMDEAATNVKRSIQCYRRALGYLPRHSQERNAALHNNLGNAFLSLPDADATTVTRNARHALHHFARALGIQPGNRSCLAYGITQFNRAQAYLRLARLRPSTNLKLAAACLREACAAFQSSGEERHLRRARAQLESIL